MIISGGRIAVADIVLTKPLPPLVKRDLMAWAGCVAGALLIDEYREKLISAGFKDVDLEITRTYELSDINLDSLLPRLTNTELQESSGAVVSAFIRAKK